MEVHFFILSTMTPEITRCNLARHSLQFNTAPSIQKFVFPRTGVTKMTIWVACQDAIINDLLPSILPYMDAAICWYHDQSTLSCLKVREAVSKLETFTDSIWLMDTTFPTLRVQHQSKIKKMYNQHGFVRELLSQTIPQNFEHILQHLQHSLQIQKNL